VHAEGSASKSVDKFASERFWYAEGSATKSVDPFASHAVTCQSEGGKGDRNCRPVSVDWVPPGWSGSGVPVLILRKYVYAGGGNIPTDSTEANRRGSIVTHREIVVNFLAVCEGTGWSLHTLFRCEPSVQVILNAGRRGVYDRIGRSVCVASRDTPVGGRHVRKDLACSAGVLGSIRFVFVWRTGFQSQRNKSVCIWLMGAARKSVSLFSSHTLGACAITNPSTDGEIGPMEWRLLPAD
jgi:hypothetical protein